MGDYEQAKALIAAAEADARRLRATEAVHEAVEGYADRLLRYDRTFGSKLELSDSWGRLVHWLEELQREDPLAAAHFSILMMPHAPWQLDRRRLKNIVGTSLRQVVGEAVRAEPGSESAVRARTDAAACARYAVVAYAWLQGRGPDASELARDYLRPAVESLKAPLGILAANLEAALNEIDGRRGPLSDPTLARLAVQPEDAVAISLIVDERKSLHLLSATAEEQDREARVDSVFRRAARDARFVRSAQYLRRRPGRLADPVEPGALTGRLSTSAGELVPARRSVRHDAVRGCANCSEADALGCDGRKFCVGDPRSLMWAHGVAPGSG